MSVPGASKDDLRRLLERAATAEESAEEALLTAVRLNRAAGVSWQGIAEILGTTQQLAHKRFAWKIEDQIARERREWRKGDFDLDRIREGRIQRLEEHEIAQIGRSLGTKTADRLSNRVED